ncbi:uncharacterized protein LOC110695746 [Chenopodium quinoa]|uniref:uncharacterized protein LOC110695746 n=1 Tax=Chenopodium quinoa TaxID=63459 RepID=UPI000B776017|nr:uncharacterized protein LOC110695746 [Chenopodium quinoa]
MKKLGGGVRSNGARVKEFSSRGVDNNGAYLFVVAMGKKVVFIELNSGSSKHDQEVDGKRGLFVVLKEMSCIDGVKSMAWLDDSLILGIDNAYSLMSCITGHVDLIFSQAVTIADPCRSVAELVVHWYLAILVFDCRSTRYKNQSDWKRQCRCNKRIGQNT